MAAKKLQSLRSYVQLFPEYQFVWFGDSGQVSCCLLSGCG
jgi:hypothetical protein